MEILDIHFVKDRLPDLEFEILKYEELISRDREFEIPLDKPHRVDFYHIIFIANGKGSHFIDLKSHPYRKHSLLFISKGQIQTFDLSSKATGWILLFTDSFLSKNLIQADALAIQMLYNYYLYSPTLGLDQETGVYFERIISEIESEYQSDESFGQEDLLRLLLKTLLLKAERLRAPLIPRSASASSFIQFSDFRSLLESRLSETRNAQDYAKMMEMSYKNLNTICKKVSGLTAKAVIDQQLVLEIKRQLTLSQLSIKELSYDLGFDEPTNFVKFFKKHSSMTPRDFREKLSK